MIFLGCPAIPMSALEEEKFIDFSSFQDVRKSNRQKDRQLDSQKSRAAKLKVPALVFGQDDGRSLLFKLT